MKQQTVTGKLSIDTSNVARRMRMLAAILAALEDVEDWTQAFMRINQAIAEFELEILQAQEG